MGAGLFLHNQRMEYTLEDPGGMLFHLRAEWRIWRAAEKEAAASLAVAACRLIQNSGKVPTGKEQGAAVPRPVDPAPISP